MQFIKNLIYNHQKIKTLKIINVIAIMLIFNPVFLIAQKNKTNILSLERKAESAYKNNNYGKAIKLYKKLHNLKQGNNKYTYKLAEAYLENKNPYEALTYFKKCLTNSDKFSRKLFFKAALAHHKSENFKTAINLYNIYKSKIKKKNQNIDKIIEINHKIQQCKNGSELSNDPLSTSIKVLNKNINTYAPEIRPLIGKDNKNLIFTSQRSDSIAKNKKNSNNKDIFIAYRKNNNWNKVLKAESSLNTNYNDEAISLTSDNRFLIIYRDKAPQSNKKKKGNYYIYQKNDEEWQMKKSLPKSINANIEIPSASYANNKNLIFFTGNNKDSKGGTDIYVMKKDNGKWSKPMNLGKKINTSSNETSPLMHPDGERLFFVSNGHNSMGGYDIFYSFYNRKKDKFSKARNLGYPINSPMDETYFSFSKEGDKIYFSSVRQNGVGKEDICSSVISKEELYGLEIKATVLDSSSHKPLEATIKIVNKNSQGFNQRLISTNSKGKAEILLKRNRVYEILIFAPDYTDYSQQISTFNISDFKQIDKKIFISPKDSK